MGDRLGIAVGLAVGLSVGDRLGPADFADLEAVGFDVVVGVGFAVLVFDALDLVCRGCCFCLSPRTTLSSI